VRKSTRRKDGRSGCGAELRMLAGKWLRSENLDALLI